MILIWGELTQPRHNTLTKTDHTDTQHPPLDSHTNKIMDEYYLGGMRLNRADEDHQKG